MTHSAMTEADLERWADAAVQRRLATDPEYRFAENAEEQAKREQEITDEVVAELIRKHGRPV